jgi:hypothetical protein
MKIHVGDRFVRDTRFGRITYNVVDIKYSWSTYGHLIEMVCYKKGNGDGITWEKSRWRFEEMINLHNARRIPKEVVGDIQSYVPRHKFI